MKIKDGYVLRKVANAGVVIKLEEMDCTQLMTLNGTGMVLWNLLRQETTTQELMKEMSERYDVSDEVLWKDIAAFLDKLRKAGILHE